ncbi:MAG: hypothetical protein PHD60_09915 [Clostridia bacterium]|nr:hypothetical protein [Clostridia bacterium]
MKIESSTIIMNSDHTKTVKEERRESLNIWVDNSILNGHEVDILDISEKTQKMIDDLLEKNTQPKEILQNTQSLINEESGEFELSHQDKLKISLIENFIKHFTGKKIKIYVPKIALKNSQKLCTEDLENIKLQQKQNSNRLGWGLEYNYLKSYHEKETLTYNATGIVKTADGQKLEIDLSLNMTREFMTQTNIRLTAGDVKIDPLVINFDGNTAELTDSKFSFDLDTDGNLDQISFLKSGSGFLSLDLNEDGIINDGKELFGPQSGNGFADLSTYDSDANGWIDENDPIFEKLRIWTKDPEGNNHLLALGEKGIGAIYLGHISTLFDIKNTENQLHGQVQKTGIFLKENGFAGTIQHIDLAT